MHEVALPALWQNMFQVAYITTDLDRAIDLFATNQGISQFANAGEIRCDSPDGKYILTKAALSYVGDIMVEIIEPVSGSVEIYRRHLAGNEFELKFHHLGYRIDTAEHLTELKAAHRQIGHEISIEGRSGEFAEIFYVDTYRSLGHYQEYVYLSPEGAAQLEQIPRN